MPWRVGIDEAGYGPNLGPFVMTAVACRVPEKTVDADLWRLLRTAVRRAAGKNAHRLFVDDSKKIYSTARGVGDLETSVLSILRGVADHAPATVHDLADRLHPDHQLGGEPWYAGKTIVPLATAADIIVDHAGRFRDACAEADVSWTLFRSLIVCPPQFNAWIERWGSKGSVLSIGLVELLNAVRQLQPADSVTVSVDKHGGRNFYSAALQEAFPDGWVLPIEEGMECSSYEIRGLDRPMRLTFRARADSNHFEAALASMISKYLREALMAEFNEFWKQHIPDLEPTAGYPGDSMRFLEAIRPALVRLQIPQDQLWRHR